jgi:hypothetical protein
MATTRKSHQDSRHHGATPINELEEAAQGHELFKAPGRDLLIDQAREQAMASGCLGSESVPISSSAETRRWQTSTGRQDLYDAMRLLETSVGRDTALDDWSDEVAEALTILYDSLERHVFEVEAADGLFAAVIEHGPHLLPDIEALRKEHEELLFSCRSTMDSVSGEADASEIRQRALGMLGRLARHRHRRSELMFDTYNVDLAAGN